MKDIFREIHDWGATIVRILVAPDLFFDDVDRGIGVIDQAIEWADKYDLYVILNFNTLGFPPTGFYSHESNSVEVTTNVEMIRFWQIISERYSGNNNVAFYEILNEASSHPWNGKTYLKDWLVLKDFYELVIDLIRENDSETIVLVSGLQWASDLSYVLEHPIQRSNAGYVYHLYPGTASNWDLAFGNIAKIYPVILTETSFAIDITGSNAWLNQSNYSGEQQFRYALMEYIDERELSWIAASFSTSWEPRLINNKLFEPNEVGGFFKDQLLSHGRNVTDGTLINNDPGVFSQASGMWESINHNNGSKRTLRITSISDYHYNIEYENSAVPLCGMDGQGIPITGALAKGEGIAFYQKLDVGPFYLDCIDGGSTGGVYFNTFLYNRELDILTDILGNLWSRIGTDETTSVTTDFIGAVGKWRCIDSSDGSNQSLNIKDLGSNQFSMVYIDEVLLFVRQVPLKIKQ